MNEHPLPAAGATSGRSGFDERLSVPVWWYVVAVGIAVLLGAEIHMGYPGVRAWIGYVICVPLFVLALFWLGRVRVRVEDGRLHVGQTTIPVSRLGRAEIVAPADKQVALGPELDPTAFLMLRAWIRPVVRIEVVDRDAHGNAPPYWVFSVRDAEGLLTALGR